MGRAVPAILSGLLVFATALADASPVGRNAPPGPRAGGRSGDTVARSVAGPLDPSGPAPQREGRVSLDPHLEPGFPAKGYVHGGTYLGGPSVHTLVGNVDEEPTLEIFATALATGPLFAWNADGSPVSGWPTTDSGGTEYPGLGNLSDASAGLEVFTIDWGRREADSRLQAYAGDGSILPGWPDTASNFVGGVPVLADVDGDGLDEIFLNEQDWTYHGYEHDGDDVPGFPVVDSGASQRRSAPAVADLDGDGDLELAGTDSDYLFAYHHDGTAVDGFPVRLGGGALPSYPVVGDVDADGFQEIVFHRTGAVRVYSPTGTLERTIATAADTPYGTAPALADLTGDDVPEIVVQTDEALDVFRGDGSSPPGWPVAWNDRWLNSAAPVVGDVDGDLHPDVVVTAHQAGSCCESDILAYDRTGALLPGFPKTPPIGSAAAAPAIADIDLDGRNEILVAGTDSAVAGYWDYLWAYDLGGGPHGEIEWGQLGGGPQHQSRYPVPRAEPPSPPPGPPSPGPSFAVADIAPGAEGSAPRELEALGDLVLFAADDGVNGTELWRSDGTRAGTRLVRDIRAGPAGSDPRQLTRVGRHVLFVAGDGASGYELWRTDGTRRGTALVEDIWPGPSSSLPRELTRVGDRLFFAAWDGQHCIEPWVSDGTARGTRMIEDVLVGIAPTPNGAGSCSDPMWFTDVGGVAYFTALEVRVPFESAGISVFRSDGTADGTVHLGATQYFSGGSETWNPGDLEHVGDRLLYTDGDQLGESDGTFEGTGWFTEVAYGLDGLLDDLTALRRRAVFPAREGGLGLEPWSSRGDPGSTSMITDLAPTHAGSAPNDLTPLGSFVYFGANDRRSGFELWRTDGTRAGTALVRDIRPGPGGSSPVRLAVAGRMLVFAADDGEHGHELWASDGTSAGTRLVHDVAPGPRSAGVREPTPAGGLVFFGADDGGAGQELWAVPLEALQGRRSHTR